MMPRIVFDLDGTLFTNEPDIDYEDHHSVRAKTTPHELACNLVREIHARGARITYLTARCHHLRDVTLDQIEHANLPEAELITAPTWRGYDHMARYKARALLQLRATLYVGDHAADATAAHLASIPFHHADAWRAGHLPDLLRHLPARQVTA